MRGLSPKKSLIPFLHLSHRNLANSSRFLVNGTILVKTSAIFVNVSSFLTRIIIAATDSRIIWKLIALCFFANVDSGKLTFLTTALLSQNKFVAPSIGTPKHFNLIRKADIWSQAILIATNSDPYVLDSHVFWRLLNTLSVHCSTGLLFLYVSAMWLCFHHDRHQQNMTLSLNYPVELAYLVDLPQQCPRRSRTNHHL